MKTEIPKIEKLDPGFTTGVKQGFAPTAGHAIIGIAIASRTLEGFMPKGTIHIDGISDQHGVIAFETENIYSTGGPDFPVLSIRTEIGLKPFLEWRKEQKTLYAVSLIRASGQLYSPIHRVVARFQQDIAHAAAHDNVATAQVTFEIPLDLVTISRIEKERAGADLQVRLTFKPLFALHNAAAFRGFFSGRVEDIAFGIPRSQWVDKILPGLGYGGLELLEVRYGPGVVAKELPKSVEEIQQGKRSLLEGHWEKCVGHCRNSIELILQSRPISVAATARFRDKVNAFLNENLPNVDDETRKLLAGQMELIWNASSPAAHAAGAFTSADAEFLVRSTMAVVEYFSRLLS